MFEYCHTRIYIHSFNDQILHYIWKLSQKVKTMTIIHASKFAILVGLSNIIDLQNLLFLVTNFTFESFEMKLVEKLLK